MGNTANAELLAVFAAHGDAAVSALEQDDLVELGPGVLRQHRRR